MNDLISRQAAIDALKNRWKKTRNYEGIGDDIAEECELYLQQVPSAQPERKNGNGRWIEDGKGLYVCSSCGKPWVHWWARVVPPNQMCKELRYCPNCGAYMRGDEE